MAHRPTAWTRTEKKFITYQLGLFCRLQSKTPPLNPHTLFLQVHRPALASDRHNCRFALLLCWRLGLALTRHLPSAFNQRRATLIYSTIAYLLSVPSRPPYPPSIKHEFYTHNAHPSAATKPRTPILY